MVALFIASILLTIVLLVWRQASVEGNHVEETSDLLRKAVLLREGLDRDLHRSLPAAWIEAEKVNLELHSLKLPIYSGYFGNEPIPLKYRIVEYRYDLASKKLFRGDRLLLDNIDDLSFEWTDNEKTSLLVRLTATHALNKVPETYRLRLNEESGKNRLGWTFGSRHRNGLLQLDEEN